MKVKKVLSSLLTVVLLIGMLIIPAKAAVKQYVDVEVIKAEERVSYMTPNEEDTLQYVFTSKSQGKWIQIYPQEEGILRVSEGVNVYDKSKKIITGIKDTEDGDIFIKNVKKTDTFYIKLPDVVKERVIVMAYIKKDNVSTLKNNILYTQSGKNKNVYQTFNITKRSLQNIYVAPVSYNGADVFFYVQRNEKKKWVSVSKAMKSAANDHVQKEFATALKKGQYRLVSKAAENQVYQINLTNTPITSKYQTKKSKAQKVKLGTTKTNVYTDTEKASRYYRVYRKTARKKRYIKVRSDVTSGNIKIRVYKKGSNRCLKTMTLKPVQTKTYRLKNGKGTYYIKVIKSGSKMSGKYSVQYK
ncbi:hypothetical protein [Anaerostipes caccae]|uniref:hypothetical protein n=1 Tax=Anaerostipes caccae TaxID=105841 RepID=UPI0038D4CAE8